MTAGNLEGLSEGAFRRARRAAGWSLWLVALTIGCSTPGKPLVECPLSADQQQKAVLAIAPQGTPRSLVEQRLKAAGIEFSPGGNGSIYYLSLWNRTDGARWHINVALLFDEAGKLYRTRPADSTTSLASETSAGDPDAAADATGVLAESPRGEGEPDTADEGSARVAFPARSRASQVGAP